MSLNDNYIGFFGDGTPALVGDETEQPIKSPKYRIPKNRIEISSGDSFLVTEYEGINNYLKRINGKSI